MSYPGYLPGDGGWCKRSGHLTPEQVRKRVPPLTHLSLSWGSCPPSIKAGPFTGVPVSRSGWPLLASRPQPPQASRRSQSLSIMEARRNAITPPVGRPVCKIRFLGAGMTRVSDRRCGHPEGAPATVLSAGQDISELPACPPRVGHQQSTVMHKPSELINVCVCHFRLSHASTSARPGSATPSARLTF